MHRWAIRVCCVLVLGASSVAFCQTEFSADMVNNERGGQGPTKIYYGKDKMRFESQSGSEQMGAMILNFDNHSYTILMPAQHMYMEMPAQQMEKRGMYNFFRTGNADDACADWLKLPSNQGGSCHKIGSDVVNGRNTVKYEATNAKGDTGWAWIDPKLRFPVKWQGKNEQRGELRNIKEGPQPASLFEIPAGYSKFDMGAMRKRPQ